GGYGQMNARLNLSALARWRQEFALFSRIAIVEPSGAAVWLGEIANPTYGMDTNGEYVSIAGLGIGNAQRDDPLTLAYVSQTPKLIIADQLSRRAADRRLCLGRLGAPAQPRRGGLSNRPVADPSARREHAQLHRQPEPGRPD